MIVVGEGFTGKNLTLRGIKMSDRNREKAEKAIEDLIDACNIMGSDKDVAEGIYNGLTRAHRTLQQTFFRAFNDAIKEYAEDGYEDGRNQASKVYAKTIVEATKDCYFPFV